MPRINDLLEPKAFSPKLNPDIHNRQKINGALTQLKAKYPHSADWEIKAIVESLTNVSFLDWMAGNTHLSQSICNELELRIQRRLNDEPLAYILKHEDFMNLTFEVSPNVLIPRPETSLLVEAVIAYYQQRNDAQPQAAQKYIDLGTGSGAIAIATMLRCPTLSIDAIDISSEALVIAKTNAKKLSADSINFFEADYRDTQNTAFETYQAILANPPYISRDEYETLDLSVKQEPKLALIAEDAGLQMIQYCLAFASTHLEIGGQLFCEIGYNQSTMVKQLIDSEPNLEWVNIIKDFNNHPRLVIVKKI
ncbi:MAG: release factor glutamine methyltransferase [Candidatus Omnitrophota bacterium]|jgi:release factor glutamine methyltransferase